MNESHANAIAFFRSSIGLTATKRRIALNALLDSDPAAHALVMAMLQAREIRHAIDSMPTAPETTSPALSVQGSALLRVGSRLGAWKIKRLIAEGGMGAVYEGHRIDGQFEQRVAIKCIRTEVMTPEAVAAFVSERNHLARLEHRNIAPLLDGGVDASGAPWFAMRYIDGAPIDRWCDEHRLPIDARIDLFLQVCGAIAYSHESGIVHQDLKPTNILMTPDGSIQLIDFGLSRNADAVGEGIRAISFGYAAPELIHRRHPVGPPADIYSLGMVLARLLTGRAPWHSRFEPAEGVPSLRELALRAPLEAAVSRGHTSAAELARCLDSDLQAIVSKCANPLPGERYQSGTALAEDLRRWRSKLPVKARGARPLYILSRFAQRNRLVLGVVGFALLSVAIGIGASTMLHHRAQHEAEASRAVAKLFDRTLGQASLSSLAETRYPPAQLLESTETQLRALRLDDHPKVLTQALNSLARSYAVVGDYARANELSEEAAGLSGSDRHSDTDAQATHAAILNRLSRHLEAEQVSRLALAAVDPAETDPSVKVRLITELARSLWGQGAQAEAKSRLDSALLLARGRSDDDIAARLELLTLRGAWSLEVMDNDSAVRDLDAVINAAGQDHRDLADQARELRVMAYLNVDDMASASKLAQDLLSSREKRLGKDHPSTAAAWELMARAQCAANKPDQCHQSAETALKIVKKVFGERHPTYARLLRVSAVADLRKGDAPYSDGIAALRRADRIMRAAYPSGNFKALGVNTNLGIWLIRAPPGPDQVSLIDEGISLLDAESRLAKKYDLPVFFTRTNLARALAFRNKPGDIERASIVAELNQTDAQRRLGRDHLRYLASAIDRAMIQYKSGDSLAADSALQSVIPKLERFRPTRNAYADLCAATNIRVDIAVQRNDIAAAKSLLQGMVTSLETAKAEPKCRDQFTRRLKALTENERPASQNFQSARSKSGLPGET